MRAMRADCSAPVRGVVVVPLLRHRRPARRQSPATARAAAFAVALAATTSLRLFRQFVLRTSDRRVAIGRPINHFLFETAYESATASASARRHSADGVGALHDLQAD